MSAVDAHIALAREYRRALFEKFLLTGQGHPGSALSMVDMAVTLYHGGYVRRDDSGGLRDRVIVSKGHAAVVLYPILARLGILPVEDWNAWGHGPTRLRVFGNRSIPGIDVTSGSLGHGVGIGAGMALSAQRRGIDRRIFVILSEGELYEGSTWEALLIATHHRLSNLTLLVDANDLIILGAPGDCVTLDPIDQKLRGLGIDTATCDGHDFAALDAALARATTHTDGPSCIVAKTIKGKGLSLMEGQAHWHYWNPMTPDQVERCRGELA